MSKPATKEPSMDEILSSIRQIIADDDAASVTKPAVAAAPAAGPEPLVLSPAQMVPMARVPDPPAAAPKSDFSAIMAGLDPAAATEDAPLAEFPGDPELVDPEDVAFEAEIEPEPEPPKPIVAVAPAPRAAAPVYRSPEPPPRPMATVAQAAPMPDPTLSSDMAEQLLAPATEAAARGAMARLGELGNTGIGAMTVEAMIRDMLKPMLKDWLDENLPSLVEGMVEKEISRISRGVK